MDVTNLVKNESDYRSLFDEYTSKCNNIIPISEKYILNEDCTVGKNHYIKGTSFVIDIPYAFNIGRIDIVLCIGNDCIVYEEINSILSDLMKMNFCIDKLSLQEKLESARKETLRIFKMLSVNDVDCLMSLKNCFDVIKDKFNTADLNVTVKG